MVAQNGEGVREAPERPAVWQDPVRIQLKLYDIYAIWVQERAGVVRIRTEVVDAGGTGPDGLLVNDVAGISHGGHPIGMRLVVRAAQGVPDHFAAAIAHAYERLLASVAHCRGARVVVGAEADDPA